MFLLCLLISSAFGFLPSRRPQRRPSLLRAIDPQIAEIIKSVIPLATFSAILTISNMRFADNQRAADLRFADIQKAAADNLKAADVRFADNQKAAADTQRAADQRFADNQKAAADTQRATDQRFADNQKAADQRFADLIKSWTEIRGADKESLDVVVSGLKSDIKNAGGGLRPEN
jgi:hypothetical protein